jgi:hypothetical protein
LNQTRKRNRKTMIIVLLCWLALCLGCSDGPEFDEHSTPPTPMAEMPPTNTFRMVKQKNGKHLPEVSNEQGRPVLAGEEGER